MPATLDVTTAGDLEQEAARTAYHTVAGVMGYVLRPAPPTRLLIHVRQDERALTVQAHVHPAGAPVLPAQVTDVVDRAGAAGGRVTVSRGVDSAIVLTAVIPCGS